MPITGVADLIGRLKQEIQSARQEGQDAVNGISRDVAYFRESADAVKRVSKELRQEADDLRIAIAEVTNGGPPLDDPSQK